MKRFLDCLFKIIFGRTLIIILMVLLQILALLGSFFELRTYYPYIWESMYVLGALLIIFIINRDEPAEFKLSWIIVSKVLSIIIKLGNMAGSRLAWFWRD